MENFIREELKTKYGYTAPEGMTRKELTAKLSLIRAMEIEPNAPSQDWF